MKKSILAGFVLIFLCCTESHNGIYRDDAKSMESCVIGNFLINTSVIDSVYKDRCFKSAQLLDTIIIFSDTCVINSTSLFTDYPFGVITNIYDFKQMFLQDSHILVQNYKIKGVYNITMTLDNSQVSVLLIEIFKNLFQRIEIVNANIVNTGITLSGDIQIGISKTFLIETFPFVPHLDLSDIRVIKLKSDFSHNNICFSFDANDILIKIEIYSDYYPARTDL